jgi:hypothetical protein
MWSVRKKWRLQYGIHTIENQSLGMLETRFYNRKGELLIIPTIDENTREDKV